MESFYKEALGQLQNINPSHSLAHIHLAALLKHRFSVAPFSLQVQRSSPLGRSLTATLGLPVSAVAQSCLTLCDLMDCSPPGSSAHGTSQAGILEWVAMPSSRGSSQAREPVRVSCFLHWQVGSLPLAPTGKHIYICSIYIDRYRLYPPIY